MQPLLANVETGGGTWAENGVTLEQVLQRYGPTIARGSPTLWHACGQRVRQHFSAGGAEPSIAGDA